MDKAPNNEWLAPYGWQWKDGSFQESPQEQAILQEIYRLYNDGFRARKIASILNQRGIPSRHRPHWEHKTIFNILKRRKKMNSS
ncbi:MAG: recombinase family protein [Bacteriovoracia bacterium]